MNSAVVLLGSIGDAYYWFLDNFAASYTRKVLLEALDLLNNLWPYLLVGILITTLVKMYISKASMASFFEQKGGSISIILAALLGVLSPLGSYVIIPLAAALIALGVPLAPMMALLIAAPLIDPNLFMLTTGALGLEMAIMRTLSALLLGISAGYLTQWIVLKRKESYAVILRESAEFTLERFTSTAQERNLKNFLFELYKMARYISKYFFLAILLAAVLKIFVNPNYILKLFANNNFLAVLFSTAAGVPLYVCGGAAIPVVQSLAELGMSKGAALAFFISGPITKISNLVLLSAAFKFRIVLHYTIIGIAGAILFGLLYNFIL